MFFTLLILPIIVVIKAGGLSNVLNCIDPNFLNAFDKVTLIGSSSGSTTLAVISVISSLAWGLGYFGQPHILTRFMAIDNPEQIKSSRVIAICWDV